MFCIRKKQEFANSKIVVVDFRTLKEKDFKPYYTKDNFKNDSVLFSIDGKVYIDKKDMWCDTFRTAFEIMIPMSHIDLENMQKYYQSKHPNIKSRKDLVKLSLCDIEAFKESFMIVMIPYEFERRKIESRYYANPHK